MRLDGDTFRSVMGHFCSGIAIVTSGIDGAPVGLTAQSFSSLSLEPPLVLFCPAKSSASWPKVRTAGHFCVNVLGEDQRATCQKFAVSGGDKFAEVHWHWNRDGQPVIDGCVAYIECSLEQVHDAGDHEIAVGRVRHLDLGEHDRPLLYYQGRYRQLSPVE